MIHHPGLNDVPLAHEVETEGKGDVYSEKKLTNMFT